MSEYCASHISLIVDKDEEESQSKLRIRKKLRREFVFSEQNLTPAVEKFWFLLTLLTLLFSLNKLIYNVNLVR